MISYENFQCNWRKWPKNGAIIGLSRPSLHIMTPDLIKVSMGCVFLSFFFVTCTQSGLWMFFFSFENSRERKVHDGVLNICDAHDILPKSTMKTAFLGVKSMFPRLFPYDLVSISPQLWLWHSFVKLWNVLQNLYKPTQKSISN